MRPLSEFPVDVRRGVRFVLCDIDDTLTDHGRLPAKAYGAMERLRTAGLKVIPVTGRPAGWCDHIARMWPVDAVVGENGAFYFHHDDAARTMRRRYWKAAAERAADLSRLEALGAEVLAAVPGAAIAADQAYREADLAIDYREDVPPLKAGDVARIVALCERAGARAKVSSIHVNAWFGEFDKLAMTRVLFDELFALDLDRVRESVVFAGDSPNDVPMFAYFPNAVGVANVRDFTGRLAAEPAWVTQARGGDGFAELADALVGARAGA
ncbi:MAG: HAD-IIB family hydrolase [Kiloniellales bacterium]